jgi:hypothetical protein
MGLPLAIVAVLALLCSTIGGATQGSPGIDAQTAATAGTADDSRVTLVGAGDIANCDLAGGSGARATAAVLDRIPGTIFTVGDHAYPAGAAAQFQDCYGPSWGRHRARTRPAPGNHDYLTANGKAYFDYFGDNAGPDRRGYYSYALGSWHVVSLNSSIPADRHSPQIEWLRSDLEEHPGQCTLAYWHVPIFSSGPHGEEREAAHMRDAWQILYEAGADVVVNGHDHDYERFAPQDAKGKADPRGIREFVVGTGGGGLYEFRRIRRNSEIRNNRSYGVLVLTLGAADYSWEFVSGAGEAFHDRGTASCVNP